MFRTIKMSYREYLVRGQGEGEYVTVNKIKRYLKDEKFETTVKNGKKYAKVPKPQAKKRAKAKTEDTKRLEKEIKNLRKYIEDPYYDRYGRRRKRKKSSRYYDDYDWYDGKYHKHKHKGVEDFMKKLDEKNKKLEKEKPRARGKKEKKELVDEIKKLERNDKEAFNNLEQLIQYYIQEWNEMAPKTLEEALEVGRICGPACFLEPNTGDYPVCAKCGDTGCFCMPLCSGLYNAKQLATFRGDSYTENIASSLALEMGCDWALIMKAYLEYKYPNALGKLY